MSVLSDVWMCKFSLKNQLQNWEYLTGVFEGSTRRQRYAIMKTSSGTNSYCLHLPRTP